MSDVLPCDCEPSTSFYVTLPCRSFAEAVRDVSKVRDLEPWVFDLLRDMRSLRASNVVQITDYRRVS